MLLRLMVVMTIVGLSSPFQPTPLAVPFASKNIYVYKPPADSDVGSFGSALCGFCVYLFVELIREV